ncbi:hypothetical protein PFISCL1PPCAC_22104, partial [Pristionchus fissidentatus]
QAEDRFGRYYRSNSAMHQMRESMNKYRRSYRNSQHPVGRREDARKFEERLADMRRDSPDPSGETVEQESPINEYLYQGDILLSEDQAESIFNETISPPDSRVRRAATLRINSRWDVSRPIYFEIYNFSESTAAMIKDSLGYWERETCVNFVENSAMTPRLRFIRGDGCWSLIGKSSIASEQDISIGAGCENVSAHCHEIGHALGLFHQQARPDRDDHVTIIEENIQNQNLDQFNRQTRRSANSYGIGYDVGSVMHYKQRGFARSPNLITILARTNGYQNNLGSHRWPTFADVKIVNAHLCSATCRNVLTCENYGYPDPNNCNQCKCPPSFTGQTCGRRHPGNGMKAWTPECGKDLVATNKWTEIDMTVGRSSSRVYQKIDNCFWVIRSPPGRRIDVWMERVPSDFCTEACERQGMRVTTRSTETTGATYCCGRADPQQLTTARDTLVIELYSYQGVSDARVSYRLTP